MRQKKENKKNNFFLKKYLLFSLTYSMISTVDGPLVKRLRRCPLTAETGVRFPYGLLKRFPDGSLFLYYPESRKKVFQ